MDNIESRVVKSQMVSVRPDEKKDRFADYATSIAVQSAKSTAEIDWTVDNAKFLVKSADGKQVLMVASNCLTVGVAEALLGEGNYQVEQLDKRGQQDLELIKLGLTAYDDKDVYEVEGTERPARLTHAVIQSGVFGEHDPFVCALCSGVLADLMHGVEEGHNNEDGTVNWRDIFLTTVPLVFGE